MFTKIGLVSQSEVVTPEELSEVALALQEQVTADLPQLWPDCQGIVNAFPSVQSSLAADHIPLIIRDDIQVNGAGIHFAGDPATGQPFGLVLYQTDPPWSVSASHECLEMVVDPTLSRTVPGLSPDPRHSTDKVMILVEVCDPCETFTYPAGNSVLLSDFCSPDYYSDSDVSPGARYSFLNSVTRPRQVLEGGYISWFVDETRTWKRMDVSLGQELVSDIDDPTGTPPLGVALRVWIDRATKALRLERGKPITRLAAGIDIETLMKRRESALQHASRRAEELQIRLDSVLKGREPRPPGRNQATRSRRRR